ncbi:MAG: peptide-methionine (R)-S-oxide reductase MsrB [Actinobacteria bacterium]|nr:peptide-methionine (R)-S-oxide reductase MsrB [Actinomycetota bacterium]
MDSKPSTSSEPDGPSGSRTEAQWRSMLPPDRFQVLRKGATEPPFSGALLHNDSEGTYCCAGCGAVLFHSSDKFDSHSGWPSFTRPALAQAVAYSTDRSQGMVRTEITCASCGGHLGHVFDDGPPPTSQRYCINSLSLEFRPTGGADRSNSAS